MWIVKLGGSLGRDPLLRAWLDELATIGSGRVVIVPGGGGFADEVRDQQAHWRFDDLTAHNMAVLAMVQFGLMLQGLNPALLPAAHEDEIRQALRQARVPLWLPFEALREQPDPLTHWGVTSDSLAAWLCNRLNGERLVLVKSCPIAPGWSIDDCAARGIVDEQFGAFTRAQPYPVELLSRDELPRMRELLLAPVLVR